MLFRVSFFKYTRLPATVINGRLRRVHTLNDFVLSHTTGILFLFFLEEADALLGAAFFFSAFFLVEVDVFLGAVFFFSAFFLAEAAFLAAFFLAEAAFLLAEAAFFLAEAAFFLRQSQPSCQLSSQQPLRRLR